MLGRAVCGQARGLALQPLLWDPYSPHLESFLHWGSGLQEAPSLLQDGDCISVSLLFGDDLESVSVRVQQEKQNQWKRCARMKRFIPRSWLLVWLGRWRASSGHEEGLR